MAPRLPSLRDMKEYLVGEPPEPIDDEQDREEYLDRIGVSESEEIVSETRNENVARWQFERDRFNTENQAISGTVAPQTFTNYFEREFTHDTFRQEYMNEPPHFRDDLLRWSNGDSERRMRRRGTQPHLRGRRHLERFRDSTKTVVHEEVQRGKAHLLETILHDVQRMIYDFFEREREMLPRNEHEQAVMVEAMVDHYLEDMGDDITMRHQTHIHHRQDSFGMSIDVQVEFPNMEPRRIRIDLSAVSMYARGY